MQGLRPVPRMGAQFADKKVRETLKACHGPMSLCILLKASFSQLLIRQYERCLSDLFCAKRKNDIFLKLRYKAFYVISRWIKCVIGKEDSF
jgi:hypothetical protein